MTFRAIGPDVSCCAESGTIPVRLAIPRLGLMPTRPLAPAGQTIEPSVSVPIVTVARFAAATTPEPELEPHGLRSSAYGLCVWPPTPLQPLDDWKPRKFAHSERFALPRTIAPGRAQPPDDERVARARCS